MSVGTIVTMARIRRRESQAATTTIAMHARNASRESATTIPPEITASAASETTTFTGLRAFSSPMNASAHGKRSESAKPFGSSERPSTFSMRRPWSPASCGLACSSTMP